MSRAASASLSTEHLLHNLSVIRSHTTRAGIIAMVKANAYGHGLRSVSLRLAPHVSMLGVASIDEALALRKAGVRTPILLAEGVFEPQELQIALQENFHVVVHDAVQLRWLKESHLNESLFVWLKIDTGLGRLGFGLVDAQHVYDELLSVPWVKKPLVIMSHLACSDELDHPLTAQQFSLFEQFAAGKAARLSISSSAAIFQHPSRQYDFVRPGIALYGASPVAGCSAASFNLKPVMTVKTKLIAVKNVQKGSFVGYGAHFQCADDMLLGIAAFGYGDGYPRGFNLPLLVNGVECRTVGRVSMDMCAIDLTQCPEACVGDELVLWGEGLPAEKVAQAAERSAYELLTGVQNRVPFFWTRSAA